MRVAFKSFLTPSVAELEAAWLSDDSIFIFDTNVLLNLYGFEEQTRTDFFATTAKLGGRIFIPYHVGLEYNLRRLSVISNEKKTFRELTKLIANTEKKLGDDLEQLRLREKFPQLSEFANELRKSIKVPLDKFSKKIEPWNKSQPDVRSEDKILELIDGFSDGRIGPPPDQAWLDELYLEGADRYANQIPPGFRDAGKDKDSQRYQATFIHNSLKYERKFGDLIIWKQILAEASKGNARNVFFHH
ncbi:PIN-like domain-containing protein [Pseudomonas sp. NPDC090201]|uniref:PIN-like domain-containing protein n=1 Tax=Pseudomonas sp. NPDC090201 TaxID=3364475 RepID=UPI0038160C32